MRNKEESSAADSNLNCWAVVTCAVSDFIVSALGYTFQKQSPRGVPRKRCSENMQQIYRRTPIPKFDFNKIAKQLC